MDDQEISITLKVAEWNVVMSALVGRPYGEVSQLIPKIQQQASSQVTTPEQTPSND